MREDKIVVVTKDARQAERVGLIWVLFGGLALAAGTGLALVSYH